LCIDGAFDFIALRYPLIIIAMPLRCLGGATHRRAEFGTQRSQRSAVVRHAPFERELERRQRFPLRGTGLRCAGNGTTGKRNLQSRRQRIDVCAKTLLQCLAPGFKLRFQLGAVGRRGAGARGCHGRCYSYGIWQQTTFNFGGAIIMTLSLQRQCSLERQTRVGAGVNLGREREEQGLHLAAGRLAARRQFGLNRQDRGRLVDLNRSRLFGQIRTAIGSAAAAKQHGARQADCRPLEVRCCKVSIDHESLRVLVCGSSWVRYGAS
jgi:hypothetical protein